MKLHFRTVEKVYGPPIICVCLAEDHGIEGKVVNAYEAALHELYPPSDEKEPSVRFVGWDFHRKCKGMAYGNIRQLLDQMSNDLQHQG